MEPNLNLGKILLIIGGLLMFTGVVLLWVGKIPFFGKLPGDFAYKSKNFSFYFPLMTSVLISIVLSGILYLVRRFF